MKKDIKNFTLDELVVELAGMGKRRFRAKQVFKWIYKRDAQSFDEMTDLSRDFRKELDEHFQIVRFAVLRTDQSSDGTQKFLLELSDGLRVETVLIPGENDRFTVCISSQVGCPLGCVMCRTGAGGFVRDLTAGEMVEQVLATARNIASPERLRNVVLMGMGEPLLNYDSTVRAIRILYEDGGMNYSARKVTLSTAGITPKMEQLGQDIEVSLAVSLHAVNDATRTRLMPLNRKYPLKALRAACRNYPLGPRQRITFEYVLIRGINDSDDDAAALAKWVAPLKSKVNLIVFNAFEGCPFEAPSPKRIARFQQILLDRNVTAMLRRSRGGDILAACGQLRAEYADESSEEAAD